MSRDDRKTHINNHFIQASFANLFAVNNKLNYINIHNDIKKQFSVKNKNSNKEYISANYFYTYSTEVGINDLESKGIGVIKKIINNIKEDSENIRLYERDIKTLKLYYLLSLSRTKIVRKDIDKNTSENIYWKHWKETGLNTKEIHEIQMINTSEIFKNEKNYLKKIRSKGLNLSNMNSPEFVSYVLYSLLKKSKIAIVKFNKKMLFLSETNGFIEGTKNGLWTTAFFPISPNAGIIFSYEQEDIDKNTYGIISNVFSSRKYEISIKNKDIYTIIHDMNDIADMCNAMILNNNTNQTIIYQDEDDVKRAVVIEEKEFKEWNTY